MTKKDSTRAQKSLCGIYQIRNTITGLVYIGQSSNIAARWRNHRHDLRRQSDIVRRGDEPCKRYNRHLLYSWAKYGEDAFEFSVLEECALSELTTKEEFWIDLARSSSTELANTKGPSDNPMRGQKHTKEALAKISAWASNFIRSETHKKNIGLSNKGKVLSEETKLRISSSKLGKINPKMRGDNNPSRRPGAMNKFRGEGNPVHKPGVKEKISAGNSKQVTDKDTGETWPSSTIAALALGVSVTAISNAARGKVQFCKGRRLAYTHLR